MDQQPVVPIGRAGAEVGEAIRAGRAYAGVTAQQLARKAGVDNADVEDAEAGRRRMPMRVLTRIAQTLAMSPTQIGIRVNGGGDPDLGVRFRQLRASTTGFTPTVVLGLMEAAWVIAEQHRLEVWLHPDREEVAQTLGFRPQPIGTLVYPPVYRRAIELAARTRKLLGIPDAAPITGLQKIVEDDLGVPLVQVVLPPNFVGATIENGRTRGIAVNVGGINSNVWARRMTVAHELGHYLWDPSDQLDRLRVDGQDLIEGDARALADPIEMRANAFAAELLAPQAVVTSLYGEYGGGPEAVSRLLQEFGVSFTTLKWQLHNGSDGSINQATLRSQPGTTPSDAWMADVGGRTDFFPLPATPIVRRGRFVDLCLAAMDANLISAETVADHMGVDVDTLAAHIDEVRDVVAGV